MADEIIEMNDDGSFSIPAPPRVNNASDLKIPPSPPSAADLVSEKDPYLEDAEKNALKSIAGITPGGYKIYAHSDAKYLSVLIRFKTPDEITSKCMVGSSSIEVVSSAGMCYKVPLSNTIKPDTAIASAFESVVLLKVERQ